MRTLTALLALLTVPLLTAGSARAQSCYGGAYAPAASVPVRETTTVTTRTYSVPVQAPQASFPAPSCGAGFGASSQSCSPAPVGVRDFGGLYGDDGPVAFAPAPRAVYRSSGFAGASCNAPQALAPQAAYGDVMLAGNFRGVGGGPSVINSRRGVHIKKNSAAALDGLFNNGGGLTINAKRVRIKKNQ